MVTFCIRTYTVACTFYNSCIFLFYVVEKHFSGVSNCEEWINVDNTLKLAALIENLITHIRNECECDFPARNIHQSSFMCTEDYPNHVSLRAHLTPYSDLTANQLVEVIEDWLVSQISVSILGQTLYIDDMCLATLSTFEYSTEAAVMSASNLAVITGSLSVVGVIIILILITVFTCFIVSRRRR